MRVDRSMLVISQTSSMLSSVARAEVRDNSDLVDIHKHAKCHIIIFIDRYYVWYCSTW